MKSTGESLRGREGKETTISFKNTTEAQERWFLDFLSTLNFPHDHVVGFEIVEKFAPEKDDSDIVGQYKNGTVVLYLGTAKRMAEVESRIQKTSYENVLRHIIYETLIHELAHSFSVVDTVDKNIPPSGQLETERLKRMDGFGDAIFSRNEAEYLFDLINKIADQSIVTSVYVNPEHKYQSSRYRDQKRRKILEQKFNTDPERIMRIKLLSELEAILIECYYNDPKKLAQIDQSIKRKVPPESFVSLVEFTETLLKISTKSSILAVRRTQKEYRRQLKSAPLPF